MKPLNEMTGMEAQEMLSKVRDLEQSLAWKAFVVRHDLELGLLCEELFALGPTSGSSAMFLRDEDANGARRAVRIERDRLSPDMILRLLRTQYKKVIDRSGEAASTQPRK